MQHGTGPTLIDLRDYDYLKSVHPLIYAGTQAPPVFPDTWLTDAGVVMPNQNIIDLAFNPPVSAMPFGCTNECTAGLATDCALGKIIFRPDDIEKITHANALGGYDIRQSLLIGKSMGWLSGFYNIKATGPLDYFGATQLAQLSGAPERRSVSFGFPWFPSWEAAAMSGIKILPMPTDAEFAAIRSNPRAFGWHNPKGAGWEPVNGIVMQRLNSWQGPSVDFLYLTREVLNAVMSVYGTVAFTGTRMGIGAPQTIDKTIMQQIVAFMRNLMGLSYGGSSSKGFWATIGEWISFIFTNKNDSIEVIPPAPAPTAPIATTTPPVITPPAPAEIYLFDTQQHAYHYSRVLCDEMGLSVTNKNILAACIYQESRFKNTAVNNNKNAYGQITSTDWGICQINDYFHVGPGRDFPSAKYIVDNPELAVRWMINMMKAGKLSMWVSYSSGAYEQWLRADSPMWALAPKV